MMAVARPGSAPRLAGQRVAGQKVLVTGASGAVALPLVRSLCLDNMVHGLARLRQPGAAQQLRDSGAVALPFDLATSSFDDLDRDYDIILNFAVRRSTDDDFEQVMATGAEAVGLLMGHCRPGGPFLHCSSAAVYRPPRDRLARETDPLGDHHATQLPTYSIGKIAAEGVARAGARAFDLATVIARLGVPYGSVWGWPVRHLEDVAAGRPLVVHPDDPMWYSPIHERDIIGQLGALLASAAVPATIVNWGGDEPVRLQEWCQLMGELLGTAPIFAGSDRALRGAPMDAAKRRAITGPAQVGWHEGFAELVTAWQRRPPAGQRR